MPLPPGSSKGLVRRRFESPRAAHRLRTGGGAMADFMPFSPNTHPHYQHSRLGYALSKVHLGPEQLGGTLFAPFAGSRPNSHHTRTIPRSAKLRDCTSPRMKFSANASPTNVYLPIPRFSRTINGTLAQWWQQSVRLIGSSISPSVSPTPIRYLLASDI